MSSVVLYMIRRTSTAQRFTVLTSCKTETIEMKYKKTGKKMTRVLYEFGRLIAALLQKR